MANLIKEYRDLEIKTITKLKAKVEKSIYQSKHIAGKRALKVDLNNYEELLIIDDRLVFIDERGLYQSIFNESLKDLIDIAYNKLEYES